MAKNVFFRGLMSLHKETSLLKRGSIAQLTAYLLLYTDAQGLIPSIPEVFLEEKSFYVAKVHQWPYLEESVQWLDNVYLPHLVPASGKLVLQKKPWRSNHLGLKTFFF